MRIDLQSLLGRVASALIVATAAFLSSANLPLARASDPTIGEPADAALRVSARVRLHPRLRPWFHRAQRLRLWLGCGAVVADPLDWVDPDRERENHADLGGAPAHEDSRLAVIVGDFLSRNQAAAAGSEVRREAPNYADMAFVVPLEG